MRTPGNKISHLAERAPCVTGIIMQQVQDNPLHGGSIIGTVNRSMLNTDIQLHSASVTVQHFVRRLRWWGSEKKPFEIYLHKRKSCTCLAGCIKDNVVRTVRRRSVVQYV